MGDRISTAGVVGLGVMGFDIAFLYAAKGYQTLVYDASERAMDRLNDRREQTIDRLNKRGRISDSETENVRRLLTRCGDLAGLARADLITEAVSENARTKQDVYRQLTGSRFAGILTTNTSAVSRATLLAGGSYRTDKFALTHFFNPVLYTQIVEVVKGDMETVHGDTVVSFLESLGRHPVQTQDISGFVSNGILMIYAVMALRLLECGARIEQIDQVAKELGLLPPFISFDSWKPSIVEDVTRVMFQLRGDVFLRSSTLLSRLARDNPAFYAERKSNPRIYDLAGPRGSSPDDASIKRALRVSILVAAARVAELGESPPTVDFVAQEGIKIPWPPLKEIDTTGAAAVLEELAKANERLPDSGLTAPRLLATMAAEGQPFYRNDEPNPWLRSQVGS